MSMQDIKNISWASMQDIKNISWASRIYNNIKRTDF